MRNTFLHHFRFSELRQMELEMSVGARLSHSLFIYLDTCECIDRFTMCRRAREKYTILQTWQCSGNDTHCARRQPTDRDRERKRIMPNALRRIYGSCVNGLVRDVDLKCKIGSLRCSDKCLQIYANAGRDNFLQLLSIHGDFGITFWMDEMCA